MEDQWSEWAIIQLDGPFYQPLACRAALIGREGGDIVIQSHGVDRRQALLQYDQIDRSFRLRDLASSAGTWVNDKLLADQTNVRLQHCDTLRFGNDASVYQLRRINTGTPPPPSRRISPAWTAQPTDMRLADCQGCIREKELQHTCDLIQEAESTSRVEEACTCRHVSPSPGTACHLNDSCHSSPSRVPDSRSMPCDVPSPLTDPHDRVPSTEELLATELNDSTRTFDPGRCNGDEAFASTHSNSSSEYNKDTSSGSTSSSPRCQKTLCTSLSSASIHSNFSEDSLIDHRDRSPPKSTMAPLPTIQQENDTSGMEEDDDDSCGGMLGLVGSGPQKAWWESEPDDPPLKKQPPSPEKKRATQGNKRESEPPQQRQQSTKYDNVYLEEPLKKDVVKQEEDEESQEEKKPPAMAFIIDFGDNAGTKKSPKIGDSLSKFVPRHRRNQSLSRAEEIKSKIREKEEKPPSVPRKPGPGGSKKPVLPIETSKKKTSLHDKNCEQQSHVIQDSRGRQIHKQPAEKPLSPDRNARVGDLNSSAQYLINKMFSSAPDAHAVFGNSDTVQHIPQSMMKQESAYEAEEVVAVTPPVVNGRTFKRNCSVEEELRRSYQYCDQESAPPPAMMGVVPGTLDSGYSGYNGAEEEDTVSEAGTYTIEKDDQPGDEARRDLDRVFGMLSDEEPLSPLDEGRGSDSPASDRQKNSAWIREWAVQVARHQQPQGGKEDRLRPKGSSPSAPTPPFSSPVGTLNKPPHSVSKSPHSAKALLSSSGESQARPRRMLPIPPTRPQAPPPQQSSDNSDSGDSPKNKEDRSNGGGRKSDSSLEAEKFLRDAESVVTAMQMRVSQMEEHRPTTPTRTPIGRLPERRDIDCSGLTITLESPTVPANKLPGYHTFTPPASPSLRRAQAQAESVSVSKTTNRKPQQRPSTGSNYAKMRRASESRGSRHSVSSEREVNCFNRSDGGRFSLRMRNANSPLLQGSVKSKSSTKQAPSSANAAKKKENAPPNKRPTAPPRSGSSLSAKEVEFQNWKRRKDYDPMRAAQQGRKSTAKRSTTQPLQQQQADRMATSLTGSGPSTPSPPILRSASFHGTDGMASAQSRNRKATYVTPQQQQQRPKQVKQPTRQQEIPQHYQEMHPPYQEMNNMSRHSSRNSNISGMSSEFADDEEPPTVRKNSVDESRGSMPTFPRGSPASSSLRGKAKLEALDSLVFGTIFSVSSKLQVAAVSILDKLKKQMSDDCDLIGKIEDTLMMVSQPDSSSGESGSPTRPLATTLKNLRKVEQTLVLLDEVLSVDLRDAPEAEASYLCKPWNGFEAEESC